MLEVFDKFSPERSVTMGGAASTWDYSKKDVHLDAWWVLLCCFGGHRGSFRTFHVKHFWVEYYWTLLLSECSYGSAVHGGIFDVRPMTLLAIDDDRCHLQVIEINFLSKLGRIGNSDETKRCWILCTLKGGREAWHDMHVMHRTIQLVKWQAEFLLRL